jgi:hypothetical protein
MRRRSRTRRPARHGSIKRAPCSRPRTSLATAVWEFRSSPLFTEGEKAALDFAIAAASVPNSVSDAMFAQMRKHWSENQIVEILAVIATFGFLNRWNDSLGTPLEDEPLAVGEKHLAPRGWSAGKHAR